MNRSARADVACAIAWGLSVAGLVLAGIYFGSRRLRDFDAALVPYAGASVLSAFGLGYRYSIWLTKPPTRLYWRRGWGLFFAPARVGAAALSLASTGALMILLKAAHPPAGGTTLIVSLGIMTRPFHLFVIEIAVAILTLQAIAINRLAGIDHPLWAPRDGLR